MKKTRRIAAIAAAAMMTAALALPVSMSAFADDVKGSITIKDSTSGNVTVANHTFAAYQIFDFDYDKDTKKISGVTWGSAITTDAQKSAIAEAAGYTQAEITAGVTASDVVEKLSGKLVDEDGNAVEDAASTAIADELAVKIKAALSGVTPTAIASANTEENPDQAGKFTNLAVGYYFVEDTTTGVKDALSKYMLQVCDDVTLAIKTDAPTLIKKIWHNDSSTAVDPTIDNKKPTYATGVADSGWNDVGDNQIGDTIYYMTESSVPDMSNYKAYEYKIHDQMCKGLTFGEVLEVVYMPDGATTGIVLYNSKEEDGDDALGEKYCKVTTGETNKGDSSTDTFTIDFENMKWILGTICGNDDAYKGGTIYTYYTATLNESAKISASANTTQYNENKAQLEYSNNPNASGKGFVDEDHDDKPDSPDDKGDEEKDEDDNDSETGNTTWDFVYDWTFVTNVNKFETVDEEAVGLKDAVFQLKDASDAVVKLVKVTAPNINGDVDTEREYYRLATADDIAADAEKEDDAKVVITDITTNANGKFAFLGLDDTVTYTLVEKAAPNGYSGVDDTTLVLTAAYDKAEELKTLTLAATPETESDPITSEDLTVKVENMKKTFSLPSTGGIGTTLFYVVGGALVAGAGVTLITKKRVGESQK